MPRYWRARAPVVPAIMAGSWLVPSPGRPSHRPYSVPIEAYNTTVEIPLQTALSAVISSAGTATIQLGPQGVGSLWRATMASVSTTTGSTDASTAQIFIGGNGAASAQGAQSYAGGGDSTGLNDALLYPGLFVIATWTGGVSGATATLVVYGRQRALIYPPVMGA